MSRSRSLARLLILALLAGCSSHASTVGPTEVRSDASLTILGYHSIVETGDTIQFQGSIQDRLGRTYDAEIRWSAAGGTIDDRGRFVAGPPGPYSVMGQASLGTTSLASTSAGWIVGASSPTGPSGPTTATTLGIDPASVTLLPGDTLRFRAYSLDEGTTSLPPYTWETDGGVIDVHGLFVAGSVPGHYHVLLHTDQFVASASVVIVDPESQPSTGPGSGPPSTDPPPSSTPSAAAQIVLFPESANLQAGEAQQFRATVTDADGTVLNEDVSWDASGGTIDRTGRFVAGNAGGDFLVVARSGDLVATSPVHVAGSGSAPPPPTGGGSSGGNGASPVAAANAGTVIFQDDFDRGDFRRWSGDAPAGDPYWEGAGDGGAHTGDGYITSENAHSGLAWKALVDPSKPNLRGKENMSKLEHWGSTEGIFNFWVSAWYYMPSNYPDVWTNLMQIKQTMGSTAPNKPLAVIAHGRDGKLLLYGDGYGQIAGSGVAMPRGRWCNITTHFVTAHNGRVEVYLDGRQIMKASYDTIENAPYMFFGVGNYISPDAVFSHIFIDDVRVTKP